MWRCYARMRRATVHPSVRFLGRPLVRCCRGATLEIREGVVINSSMASNPVIGHSRSALSSVAPGAVLVLGRNVGASGVTITAATEVTIGDNTIIGADTLITDTDFHLPDGEGGWSNALRETSKAVRIGTSCFIGARSIILKGVTIGDGTVVAAGAVVTRDVPAMHLAYGNPATHSPLPDRWRQNTHGKD